MLKWFHAAKLHKKPELNLCTVRRNAFFPKRINGFPKDDNRSNQTGIPVEPKDRTAVVT